MPERGVPFPGFRQSGLVLLDLSSSQAAGKLLDPIREKERGKSNF